MREMLIKFLYFTLAADRQLHLRAELKCPTIDDALAAQGKRISKRLEAEERNERTLM